MNEKETVLLIKPGWRNEVAFPLDLACLSSVLKKAGWRVEGRDLDFDFFDTVLGRARASSVQAVILSVRHFQLRQTISLVQRLSALRPDLPVLLVGEMPSLEPEKTLLATGARLAIRGDPERVVIDALAFVRGDGEALEGVVWMEDGQLRFHGPARRERDLHHLEAPDRDFLPLLRYGRAYRSVALPFAAAFYSRGCLSSCRHCQVPALRRESVAYRDAATMAEEMRLLSRRYGIRAVHFEDDAFAARPEKVDELCEKILKRKPPVAWELVNGVRPREMDPALFPAMAAAGCRRIALGVETLGVPHDAVSAAWRHEPDLIRRIVRAAHRSGISITGYFLLGLPDSTLVEDTATVRDSRELGLDLAHYSVYEPWPGSYWESRDIVPLSDRREALARRAYRRFYLTPGQVFKLVREIAVEPGLAPAMASKTWTDLAGLSPRSKR